MTIWVCQEIHTKRKKMKNLARHQEKRYNKLRRMKIKKVSDEEWS